MDSLLKIPERFLRNTEPVELFTIQNGEGDKSVCVQLLSVNKAEIWAEEARRIDDIDQRLSWAGERYRKAIEAINEATLDEHENAEKVADEALAKMRSMQKDRFEGVKECLRNYDANIFNDEMFDKATTAQLVNGYERLKQYNDPFVVSTTLQVELLADLKRQKGLRIPEKN